MGKPKRERSLPENEAKAWRRTSVSPQKLNLVAGLIRGKKVDAALADLEFSRKRIAQRRAQVRDVGGGERREQPRPRRQRTRRRRGLRRQEPRHEALPRAGRGRSGKIVKPFSQITVVVREVEEKPAGKEAE